MLAVGRNSDDALILSIYECVTREDALARVLQLLAERFGCVAGALAFADPSRPGADFVLGYGVFDAAAMDTYRQHYADLDPAPRLLAGLPLGSVLATGQVFSDHDLATSRFFQNFYRPLGLEETLGGPVTGAPSTRTTSLTWSG